MMTNNEKKAILSNKDLDQVGIRWFMSIETFNYETQLIGSYAFAVMSALRKIYEDDSELMEAMDNRFKYFNCMPWLTNLILGATLTLEDSQGIQAKGAVQDLKVSLMGPLSGIGDSTFFILIPTILGSIIACMAQDGNPLDMVVWYIYGIVIGFIGIESVSWGYKGGLRFVSGLGKKLSVFTNSISAVGLTVVGALMPSLMEMTTPLIFKMSEITQEVQTVLDTIISAMIPAIFAFISYKLLGRNVKISWLVLIIAVSSWIYTAFGILTRFILVSTTAINVAPRCPVKLCGYINDIGLTQRTQTVHAPVYAITLCLVLENSQLLILMMGILSTMKNRAEQVKGSITQAYSIKKGEIFIHAVHTHVGPSGFSVDAMGKEYEDDITYREDVISRICTGLRPVFAKTEEARAFMGKIEIHGFYGNRDDRNRYYDADACRLQFRSDDQLVAELMNINVHSTVLGPTNMEVSYDLIDTMHEELHKRENIYPLLCIDTSTDISNRHYREGDDSKGLNRTTKGITSRLLEIQNLTEIDIHILKLDTLSCAVSYDSTLLFSDYQEELEEVQKNLEAETDKTKRKLLLSSKDKFKNKLLIHKVHEKLKLSLLRSPELLLITFPGELTFVFGKYIREQAKTLFACIMTCTNDRHGYFIEQDQYRRCYEATTTLIPRGETEKMIKKLGELL